MTEKGMDSHKLLNSLRERSKELNCLYMADEILMSDISLANKLQAVAESIPQGWYSPAHCKARIVYRNSKYNSSEYVEGGAELSEDLVINGSIVGVITVTDPANAPELEKGDAFLE